MKKILSLILCVLLLASLSGAALAEEAPITFPYTGEEVVFSGFAYDGLDQNPEQPGMQAWQEHIGNMRVDYEFIAYTDYLEKAQILLATGDIPDVLPVNNVMDVVNQYGSSGILLDFNEYLDYMPNLKAYLETYPNLDYVCDAEGHRYAIIGVQPLDKSGESWFANWDVLRAAGIEEAPETMDELLEAMRAVKAYDPTIIPFQSYWNIDYTMGWMARASLGQDYHEGSLVYYDTETGEYQFAYRGESAEARREIVELMRTLYAEGLINSEIATMSFEQELATLASGKWAFTALYRNSPEMEVFKVGHGEALPFDIQPMLPPKAADGNRYMNIAYQHDGLPTWGIVCSADTEHPELLAAYMDQVVSPFGRDNFNYGVEGVTFDYVDGLPVAREGVDTTGYTKTQYEVWMVGMGMPVETDSGYILGDQAMHMNVDAFVSGEQQAIFSPVFTTFSTDAATEKSSLENDLTTYIKENEAAFIYGQRDIAEWDAFLEELESIADIDALLELYNEADTIVRNPERVFVVE